VCEHDKNPVFIIGSVALAGVALLWLVGRPIPALMMIGLGMLSVTTLASRIRRVWCVTGLAYAGILLIAPVVLRHDAVLGFWAIVYLFAVVWGTDIGAYIAGRALGGPKLVPRISPNKTWAGAIGGLVAGVACAMAVAKFAGIENLAGLGVLALILSIISQIGD